MGEEIVPCFVKMIAHSVRAVKIFAVVVKNGYGGASGNVLKNFGRSSNGIGKLYVVLMFGFSKSAGYGDRWRGRNAGLFECAIVWQRIVGVEFV